LLCSINNKLNFDLDLFKIVGKEMEISYKENYLNNVLLHKLFKLFEYKELKEFKNILTNNYLYLLTKKQSRPEFFLDKLYNDSLVISADLKLLYGIRQRFSKYLFNKNYKHNINNEIYILWEDIIEFAFEKQK
jgi:hypothetical protein